MYTQVFVDCQWWTFLVQSSKQEKSFLGHILLVLEINICNNDQNTSKITIIKPNSIS